MNFKSYEPLFESASIDGFEFIESSALDVILDELACCPHDNGKLQPASDMFYSGLFHTDGMKTGRFTMDWEELRLGVTDEQIIEEYKRFDPELKFLVWWYGEDADKLVLPHSHDIFIIENILAHWEAVDRGAVHTLHATGKLVHKVIRLTRICFSEFRRLDYVLKVQFESIMSIIVRQMILSTSPHDQEFFPEFEPPVFDSNSDLISEGIGLAVRG